MKELPKAFRTESVWGYRLWLWLTLSLPYPLSQGRKWSLNYTMVMKSNTLCITRNGTIERMYIQLLRFFLVDVW